MGLPRERMSRGGLLRFLIMRFWLNLKAAFEYRASFWSQVFFMMANNAFMLWFWQVFFGHFGSVRDWHAGDMYLLYGVSAASFGLANILAGNAIDLAGAVADGELDYFIGLPAPTLVHALVTRIRVSAIGDLLFGFLVLGFLSGSAAGVIPHLVRVLMVCVPAAMVFVSVAVLAASLAFYVGESRGISFQLVNLLITFGTYPESIFQGSMRWVIFILIPAGLFAHLPADALRARGGGFWGKYLILWAGALAFVALATIVFHRGLRRYASGNALALRT